MTTTSKSELADMVGVSSPRISQYCAQGLPVLSDGKIDLNAALKWLSATVDGPAGQRARELLRDMAATDDGNPAAMAMHAALGALFAFVPSIALEAAREAGASEDVLTKIAEIAHAKARAAGDEVTEKMLGLAPRGEWPDLSLCLKLSAPDASRRPHP